MRRNLKGGDLEKVFCKGGERKKEFEKGEDKRRRFCISREN
ncbi:MAG TPA: hypothetical protein PK165_05160 [bacterium]|nr:hypothetical protein [bacterium]HPO52200.1 hypothetical protein [bacterium]